MPLFLGFIGAFLIMSAGTDVVSIGIGLLLLIPFTIKEISIINKKK